MNFWKLIVLIGGASVGLCACGVVSSPLLPGSEAAAAKNQIMLVRQNPPTFGFQRLVAQTREFPDVGVFINGRGIPDFLAETGRSRQRYLIFYYLKDREAYACRTRLEDAAAVEFSGPYTITKNEYQMLDRIRKQGGGIDGNSP